MSNNRLFLLLALIQCLVFQSLNAAELSPPTITNFSKSGSTIKLQFPPYPAAQGYSIQTATNLAYPFASNTNFLLSPYFVSTNSSGSTNYGYEWRATNIVGETNFFRIGVTPLSSNALLAANALNRLAYGPTPDDLTNIAAIGPQTYIDQQLAPWTLTENVTGTHPNFPIIESKFVEATNFVYTTNATIADLRAWHILRAIGAKRQLLEVLLQFLENHFVTQWSKSKTVYFDQYYDDGNIEDILSTQLEYLENEKWRSALLNSTCTFYDLLKISAESPAMIIYLDTYSSRGDTTSNTKTNVANENYAREVMELFCMGVDNGYDQTDVTAQSQIWTGWRVEKVDFTNAFNPYAARTTTIIPGSTNSSTTSRSNLFGVWAFNYQPSFHYTNSKTIFASKVVPARFGAPWTTKTYGTNTTPGLYKLFIPGFASITATNGISDGYSFLTHIADLPFTEEYISIKLCRLLVHDDFPNPSNDTNDSAYAFYDYAAGNLSPEAELVHGCMLTWETNSPKGQIWKVLKTITDSELFRSHGGAGQKVKTPFEYAISAVRTLRSSTNGSGNAGSFTAYSDGYNIGGTSSGTATILTRAGNMLLFDRDAPDGYPEAGPPWISAGTLSERLRFVQSFCIAVGQAGHTGSATNDAGSNTGCDIVGLLTNKTSASTWTNAGAVADYFLGILFPGEGAGNLSLYRTAAINFLNDGSADTDITPDYRNTPFAGVPVTSVAGQPYDERVRGMVGMLMTMQRFQEQ